MRKAGRKNRRRDPASTANRLIEAAEREFNTRGFEGTDTNRIAKAAGFAPQTFYRHFKDKTDIFIAVYERWWQGEAASLTRAIGSRRRSEIAAARIALEFHTSWRMFRRSLRHLAIVDPKVRAARAAARRAQIGNLRNAAGRSARSDADLIAALLSAERLCDAVAEGELADLRVSPAAARRMIAEAMARLLGVKPGGLSEAAERRNCAEMRARG